MQCVTTTRALVPRAATMAKEGGDVGGVGHGRVLLHRTWPDDRSGDDWIVQQPGQRDIGVRRSI
jgi:hypothetical protein